MDINADTHKSQEKTSDVFDSYSSLYGRDKQQQQQQQKHFPYMTLSNKLQYMYLVICYVKQINILLQN